jgi:hypothetical protein
MLPPAATHAVMISRLAFLTRSARATLRRSKLMFGCRFPVAGVEDVADVQAVAIADLADPVEYVRQRGAGHHGILHHQVGCDAAIAPKAFLRPCQSRARS